jgi:hypothetical protein
MELIILSLVSLLVIVGIIVLLSYIDSKLDDSHTEDWDTHPSEQIAPLLGVVQPNDKKDNK